MAKLILVLLPDLGANLAVSVIIVVKILLEGRAPVPETIGIMTENGPPPTIGACEIIKDALTFFPLYNNIEPVVILMLETLYLFPLYVTGGTLDSSYERTILSPVLDATQLPVSYTHLTLPTIYSV